MRSANLPGWWAKALTVCIGIGLLLATIPVAQAFSVPGLPADNLVRNPWFRDLNQPGLSGLDGWTDAAGVGRYWSSSQKVSNPSPDVLISPVCGGQSVYCGTAARLSLTTGESGGVGETGVDAYLTQVVAADQTKQLLRFFTHWVSHRIEPAEVVIHGGDSPDGPWAKVWTPFYLVQDELIIPASREQDDLWTYTELQETELEQGYPYYKVEIHARLPEGDVRSGFKITGVYFAAADVGSPQPPLPYEAPPDATPVGTDSAEPAVAPTDVAASTGETTPAPTRVSTSGEAPPVATPDLLAPVLTVVGVSDTQVMLAWEAVPGNSRGYKLERSLVEDKYWENMGLLAADVTTFTDSNLIPGTTYYYRLRVSSREDDRFISNVVSVATNLPPTPTPAAQEATVTPTATAPALAAVTLVSPTGTPMSGSAEAIATPAAASETGQRSPVLWLFGGVLLGVSAMWLFLRRRRP